MQMAAGMDTGDILLQRTIKIDEEETGGSLFDKLSKLGGELIVEALPKIERGEITPVPQDEALATKCGKLSKDMGRIDFSEDAESIRNLIRGLNPWPSAFTYLGGKMLKIWHAKALSPVDFGALCNSLSPEDGARAKEIANTKAYGSIIAVLKDSFVVLTGDGYLQITEVQLVGKKRMDVKAFLLGNKLEIGTVLK
jgi:methionyl-tRNA formyltransferase